MNEIVKKKSFLKYIIAGIFILILISIALLIYVLIRKKGVTGITYISQNNVTARCAYPLGLSTSDSNEDSVKATCDLDPSCVGYYTNGANPPTWSIATKTDPSKCNDWQGNVGDYPVYKSKASGYSKSANTDQKYGCPYPLGLSTSDSNEDAVKATCDLDPSCAGYYTSSDHGWSIATKTDPSKCDEKTGVSGYTIFYKKNPPPPPPKVGTYTEISNSAPSKKAYACFDSVTVSEKTEDVQRVLCDNDDDCAGYYFNPSVPGSMVYTIDKKCTDTTESLKIAGYDVIKLKDYNNYAANTNPKLYGSMSCTKNFYAARLSSEPGAEDTIKKICNELPNCKGYYKKNSSFIASKNLPSEIESDDESVNSLCFSDDDDYYEKDYPYFMKKEV